MNQTTKVVLITCGVLALLALLGIGGCVAFVAYVVKDPEGMLVTLNSPATVRVGETFDFVVEVQNARKGKELRVGDIDFAEEYFAGFAYVSATPSPKTTSTNPFGGAQAFTMEHPIPAGQTARFTFRLRATKVGLYRGDLDVYEKTGRFLTHMAQTEVTP